SRALRSAKSRRPPPMCRHRPLKLNLTSTYEVWGVPTGSERSFLRDLRVRAGRVCYNFAGFDRRLRRDMPAKKSASKKSSKKKPIYQRILLKISGESLQGPQGFGVHGETIQAIARELKEVHDLGVEI